MPKSFNFDFENSTVYRHVKWGNLPNFNLAHIFNKVFFFLFTLTFLVFLFGFFSDLISITGLSALFGLSLISLTISLGCWWREAFFNSKLKKPQLNVSLKDAVLNPQKFNLAEFLSFEAMKAVVSAVSFSKKNNLNKITSTVLLYSLLEQNKGLRFVFSRILLDINDIKKILKEHLKELALRRKKISGEFNLVFSEDFQKTILESFVVAKRKGNERVSRGDLLTSLSKNDLIFKKILMDSDSKTADIENLTGWLEFLKWQIAENKRFWKRNNLSKMGSLAKSWSAGYTVTLDAFGLDISEIVRRRGFPGMIGHQKEIKAVERVLARGETNNCLLIGEPGVGKKSLILELAKRSLLGESLPAVNYKRVVQLDLTSIAAKTDTVAEAEAVLDTIFQEAASAGNVILVIDELHNFIGGANKPGIIDISGIMGPYLNLPQLQLVGITTFAGLHKYIEQKPAILSLLDKVELGEVTTKETLMILEQMVPGLERKYGKFISFPALREIISLADKYYPVPFPKSAMDLLDESLVYLSSIKDKVLLPKHIQKIVSGKTEVPIGEVEDKERVTLLNLEELLHERIINQTEAVRAISAALRRSRAQVSVRKGPLGTFLFLGPTGVGKTETSKALCEIYFGSEEKMIRLDMSEFQSVTDIPRLLGSPGEEGLLTTQVRENPFSLILLDELEKAHPNILNLFLQVLDEGFLTDGLGRKVDFKNCIIIATSNAGYKIILKALKEGTEWIMVKREILDYLFEEGVFRPEFVNRFDSVVVFTPLSKENLLDIAELMLQKIKRNLEDKNIEFIITSELKQKIVELGYNPAFGAREMKRVIQDNVENVLASGILSGGIEKGDRVRITSEFRLEVF